VVKFYFARYLCYFILVIITFASINLEESNKTTLIIQYMLIGCLAIVSIILILRFINLILYIKQKEEIVNQLTISMTLRIKLGLIPFFIINYVFSGILWIGTFNIFLIFIAHLYLCYIINYNLFVLIN